MIKPPRSPHKATPCGIAPLSRRGADRARPAARCRNGVSAETPAIERGVRDVVTYADMFTYTLVLIGLASLVVTAFRHKK